MQIIAPAPAFIGQSPKHSGPWATQPHRLARTSHESLLLNLRCPRWLTRGRRATVIGGAVDAPAQPPALGSSNPSFCADMGAW